MKLSERVETSTDTSGVLDQEVLSALGFEQRLYERAGWKFVYPNSGRVGSALFPTRSLQDVLSVYFWLGDEPPELIYSCPRRATAAALKARNL